MALTVYLIDFDVGRFHSLSLDLSDAEFAAVPDLNGHSSVARNWPTPPVHLENPTGERPDLWHLYVSGAAFAIGEEADSLEPLLSGTGEFLPLETSHIGITDLQAFNVLTRLRVETCMDLSRGARERDELLRIYASQAEPEDYAGLLADAEDGDPWPVLYPEFIASELPQLPSLFRVDRLPSTLFLLENDDAEDRLLRRLVDYDVQGATYHRIWSSATGGVPMNLLG